MSWRPVLEGDGAVAACAAIAQLADQVAADPLDDPTLIRGAAGAALLHGTLARAGDAQAAERAHAALGRALERIGEVAPGPWLGTGFVGVAWVMNHLADVIPIEDDALAPIDEMITELLGREDWPYECELWQGLVGIGVYVRARGRRDLVARVVEHLDRRAERGDAGATWWNRDAPEQPRYINLGIPHGMAGIAVLLADAVDDGISPAEPLLREAMRWLLALDRPGDAPRFPPAVGLTVPDARRRNGWCYGDLPIAIAAVRAGRALGEPRWIEHGGAIARAMAPRPADEVAEYDAAFCHGAAGRAHMFNRLGQTFGDSALVEAARRYYLDAAAGPASGPALATGAAGIALALIGASSATPPTWDQALLTAM